MARSRLPDPVWSGHDFSVVERAGEIDRPLVQFLADVARRRRARFAAARLGVRPWTAAWWLERAEPAVVALLLIVRADGVGRVETVADEAGRAWRARVVTCRAGRWNGSRLALRGLRAFIPRLQAQPRERSPWGSWLAARLAVRDRLSAGDAVSLTRLAPIVAPVLAESLAAMAGAELRAYARYRRVIPSWFCEECEEPVLRAVHVLGGRALPGPGPWAAVVREHRLPTLVGLGPLLVGGDGSVRRLRVART